MSDEKLLLVGDNPFHGISHLSQEQSRIRGYETTYPEYAASLVATSLGNGANGFMFSVSEATLSILKIIGARTEVKNLTLYAIIPYAYEYVRLAAQIGVNGLAKRFVKQVVTSGNIRAISMGLKGLVKTDPISILKTYIFYELSRIKSSLDKKSNLQSVLLHEVITDMCLALDLDWLFRSYIDFVSDLGIKPGFNTRNFVYFARKLKEWRIRSNELVVATPFNKIGFQMNPSKAECEKTLAGLPELNTIAISILAAGYLKPLQAIEYIAALPNIKGVAIGVSKKQHACETFKLLKERLI